MAHGISAVSVANMALSNVGAKSSIESFDEESPEAKQVKLWYDISRAQVLEAYDWNFARKRQALATSSVAPPEGVWAFRYQYPSDCLAAREIENPFNGGLTNYEYQTSVITGFNSDAIPFEVEADPDNETKSILTDMDSAVLVYTYDLVTVTMFSSFFVETLSHMLAHHIAFSLTGKRSIKQDMLKIYLSLIEQAPAHNANERVGKAPREAEWIRGRQ